jgi:hypothetical protein
MLSQQDQLFFCFADPSKLFIGTDPFNISVILLAIIVSIRRSQVPHHHSYDHLPFYPDFVSKLFSNAPIEVSCILIRGLWR